MEDGEFPDTDIEAVLRAYGWDESSRGGGQWRSIRCPFHNDTQASASYTASGGFSCHGCGLKGDSIKLLMEVENTDYRGAVRRYEEITGRSVSFLSRSTDGFSSRGVYDSKPGHFERGSGLFPDWYGR